MVKLSVIIESIKNWLAFAVLLVLVAVTVFAGTWVIVDTYAWLVGR